MVGIPYVPLFGVVTSSDVVAISVVVDPSVEVVKSLIFVVSSVEDPFSVVVVSLVVIKEKTSVLGVVVGSLVGVASPSQVSPFPPLLDQILSIQVIKSI